MLHPLPVLGTTLEVLLIQSDHALHGKLYSYRLPDWQDGKAPRPGRFVLVRVGHQEQPFLGLIADRKEGKPAADELRPIEALLEAPELPEKALAFYAKVAAYYGCSLADVLLAAIPASLLQGAGQRVLLPTDRLLQAWREAAGSAVEVDSLPEKLLADSRGAATAPGLRLMRHILEQGQRRANEGLSLLSLSRVMKETPAALQVAIGQLRQAGLLRWDVAVPEGLEQEALWLANVNPEKEADGLKTLSPTLRRHYRQLDAFWQSLSEPRGVRAQAVCSLLGLSFRSLQRLQEAGLVTLARDFPDLDQVLGKQQRAYAETLPQRFEDLQLNREQQAAFERVRQATGGEGFLLWGVTGSGKTEVYLKLLEHTIAQGKTALVLFPEIALTQALYERFTRRLGSERVVVWHSQRSDTEKRQSWHRIASGEVSVVLGARSAVFVPLPRLGLILLDECHDDSFKQETPAPRYDARTLAHWLAQEHHAPLVLGSATPTVPQFYRAETHELTLLPLRQRYQARSLPEVSLLRARPRKGFACLSDPLIEALERTLEAGQQAIVLLNRRGYHTLVQCQVCGHVFECQTCSVAMTVHKAAPQQEHRHLYCHQCDAREPMPQFCPHCAAQELATLGMGTQRLEAELQQALPSTARVSRLDGDVLRSKRAYAEAMTRFSQGASDILVGTQIIAKGLDIPNVTLVGVIQADAGLKVPDFKAQERLFQLLTQVAGRSGRGEQPGKVLLQVIDPDHPVLGMAVAQDFERFYRYELDQRLAQGYPPFSQLLRLVFSATEEERARFFAQAFSQHLSQHLREAGFSEEAWQLQGPALATVAKVKDYWRYQSLLKNKAGGDALRQAVLAFVAKNPAPKGIRLLLDVDAESLL